MSDSPALDRVADKSDAGRRLDAAVAAWLPSLSRSILRRAIDAGHATVDGQQRKPSHRLSPGERVVILQLAPPPEGPLPEAIPLDLLYEDDDLVAVNKPARMVVHPAKGHWQGTLAAALAHHFGDSLSKTGGPTRPGIVHRLDRDTTGVIVVAKHDGAHEALAKQFADRTTEKQYLAIVSGVPDRDADVIDQPIGPHPKAREKMAIRPGHPDSRDALTRYEVMERFSRHALLRCLPKTGRTHQIRVHLAHAGYPVLCDKLYGGTAAVCRYELMTNIASYEARHADDPLRLEPVLARQALHAHRLRLSRPTTGETLALEAPLAADMSLALATLRGES